MKENLKVPGLGHRLVRYWSPYGLGRLLLLEPTLKDVSELLHVKHTHCRAGNAGIQINKQRNEHVTREQREHLASRLVHLSVSVPVGRRGEQTQDNVAALHAYDAAGGVQEVEVKVGITGHGAVEPRFEKRGPLLLQDSLGAAQVCLAHAGHPGNHHLKQEPALTS